MNKNWQRTKSHWLMLPSSKLRVISSIAFIWRKEKSLQLTHLIRDLDKIFFRHCNAITRNHWNPFCQNGLKKFCLREHVSQIEREKFYRVELVSQSEQEKFCPRGPSYRIGRGKFCQVEPFCHRHWIHWNLHQKHHRWIESRRWQCR